MKIIKYKLMTEINHGTEEEPNIVQTFRDVEIQCSEDNLEANYAIAQREAYGEITVEEVPDAPHEATELEQLRADVDYIAMETGVEL